MQQSEAGVVARVHGPTWSVVLRVRPWTGPLLVCVDDLADRCWQIADDSAQAAQLIAAAVDGAIHG